ncbi:MAG: Fe(3+)-hydroxamate ABC transporter permease FhuB [Shinella sp.]|nr:Fe(3+)-hydroxamate ABC transporter permease FhuB [Shinella sp.]
MAERRLLPWIGLAIASALLFAYTTWAHLPAPGSGLDDLRDVILYQSQLPRAVMALLCGAGLGLAGALLQRVLRNPLAEPSTLGISAGAQLALAAAAAYTPALLASGREAVAFAGAVTAIGVVLALNWKRDLEPVSVILAGMMVSLTATAASASLILANGEYMFSLFIWGGGSLTQQSWHPSFSIALRILIVGAGSLFLLRPLAILGLGDAHARNLGIALPATRLLTIALAVWLAASITAEVGIIGFIGLAAPALAQLSGARTPGQKLYAAPFIGGILLWFADGLVQLVAGGGAERVPTGAATALLGGPLLLWMLPRLRMFEWPSLGTSDAPAYRTGRPGTWLILLTATACVVAGLSLSAGWGPTGWLIAKEELLSDFLQWRLPRVGIALAAGAMLAAAGTIMQRLTGNPLASPEVLGVGMGAGVGLSCALFLFSSPSLPIQLAGAAFGSLIVLVAMLTISARSHFGPEKLLLGGIAMSALCSAVLTAVIATGSPTAFRLLGWISGSTDDATAAGASLALASCMVLIAPLFLARRWLDILPLGATTARELGLSLWQSRASLVVLCGLLSAVASLFVGPLSFVGLIAPHLARFSGLHRPLPALTGSILIGMILMLVSDWLSRMVAYPYQLPLGLFASMLGGIYLVWLLSRSHPHSQQ